MDRVEASVAHYIQHYRQRASEELDWYARRPSFDEAIERAAMAETAEGKRHSHQRRLTRASLSAARGALLANRDKLRGCGSFDELFQLIDAEVGPIDGLGELYIYDTSLRIGSHLHLLPKKVYLHAGTREGAKALGFDGSRQAIHLHQLPSPFLRLLPYEAEDLLCIYKEILNRVNRAPNNSLEPTSPARENGDSDAH